MEVSEGAMGGARASDVMDAVEGGTQPHAAADAHAVTILAT